MGTIGDSFGALNTLFSGLALAGLAITITLQLRELKSLADKEEQTTKAVAAQTQALKHAALLTYYNNEIDRLERLSEYISTQDAEAQEKFWIRADELKLRREKLVIKVELQS